MFGACMCLFCVCVVLYLGRRLATSRLLAQGVLPSVKMIMKLKKRPGLTGAVEPELRGRGMETVSSACG
jgi:hypothetical protein